MKLKGNQIHELMSTLLDAYPTRTSLARMVRIELDQRLDVIASSEDLADAIYTLIEWAEANGQLDKLIVGAGNANPGNKELADLAARWAPLWESHESETLPLVYTPRIGRIPHKLSPEEELSFLDQFPSWRVVESEGDYATGGFKRELYRVYEFPSFELAFQFMQEVTEKAILRYDHHPRWQNTYNRVEVWLTTFNCGYRPSVKDRRLAKLFENTWQDFQETHFKLRRSSKHEGFSKK